ncbi:C2 domain-containing protein, partial [Russula aff. rugulosa BPL654]
MSVDLRAPGLKAIRVVVVAAHGLAKLDVFNLPDPYAVIIIDSEQTHVTSVIKKTLNPYWNEHFDVIVKGSSVVTVQIFDQRKFKRRDQGFLGFVEIRVTDYLDLELGGQGIVQLDLKGTDDLQGKLISH